MTEASQKIRLIQDSLAKNGLAAIRLRGVDWFSWATCGGSSVVILTNETGVGEVLVTPKTAWVITNSIEQDRFRQEEIPQEFEIWFSPWEDPSRQNAFVSEQVSGGKIASDRPRDGEVALPADLVALKRRLMPSEIERYRKLGRDAAEAMTETLDAAQPTWTEFQLAGEGARNLWKRGIHPTLTLAGGESRVARHRHPTATSAPLGSRAMLVFCARRHGLYANFTRWVYFRQPTAQELELNRVAAQVEAQAWSQSKPGHRLNDTYASIVSAYARLGYPGEHQNHHQGGTTGYLSREVVANPKVDTLIEENTALAWNPSLAGAKMEDTVLTTSQGIEILTVDPAWPTFEVEGRKRPDLMVK